MKDLKNIFIIAGGGKEEHEISLISAKYFHKKINQEKFNPIILIMNKMGDLQYEGDNLDWPTRTSPYFRINGQNLNIHKVIPCFHGYPGETGHFQAYLEMHQIPYMGSSFEGLVLSFNKISTKLYLEQLGIPTVPFQFLQEPLFPNANLESFFNQHQSVYVKAASQGSSVGCYPVHELTLLEDSIKKAFKYSNQVLIEKTILGRELEVAVFQYKDEIRATFPGEIKCSQSFYSYEEKYSQDSSTETLVEAPGINSDLMLKIKEYAIQSFKALKLKDLARVDFFLEQSTNQIYLNEINSLPGHTDISMFPQMLEHTGLSYSEFLQDRLLSTE